MRIKYVLNFELTDIEALKASYPNFVYDYRNFDEFVGSYIDGIRADVDTKKGVVLRIGKRVSDDPRYDNK